MNHVCPGGTQLHKDEGSSSPSHASLARSMERRRWFGSCHLTSPACLAPPALPSSRLSLEPSSLEHAPNPDPRSVGYFNLPFVPSCCFSRASTMPSLSHSLCSLEEAPVEVTTTSPPLPAPPRPSRPSRAHLHRRSLSDHTVLTTMRFFQALRRSIKGEKEKGANAAITPKSAVAIVPPKKVGYSPSRSDSRAGIGYAI